MKKFLLTIAIAFAFLSCSEESPIEQSPKEVEVSLDYSFIESGCMTRVGNSVYTEFYNKYVKTKLLTPKNFELIFKNKETGAVATIKGNWNKKHFFKLITGEYEVIGKSHPTTAYSMSCLDSLYLSFKEDVTITTATEGITLTANYDSYMLLFDQRDKTQIEYCYGGGGTALTENTDLKTIDDIYYAFFCQLRGNINNIRITRNKEISNIVLNDIPFEKGKYYYFNDINNSFNIPPMGEGN